MKPIKSKHVGAPKTALRQKNDHGHENGASTRTSTGAEIGGVSLEALRELASIVQDHGLSELALSLEGVDVTLRRGDTVGATAVLHAPVAVAAPHAAPAASHAAPAHPSTLISPAPAPADLGPTISSPFVGTFYRAPSPEAPNFVEIGQRVKKGQVLCIVEAMKLMNEIEAEHDGTIAQCLVDNAQSVEYGQALFRLAVEA